MRKPFSRRRVFHSFGLVVAFLSISLQPSLAFPESLAEIRSDLERSLTAMEGSVGEIATLVRPNASRAEIFEILRRAHAASGVSLAVFDSDGRFVAWDGNPVDVRSAPLLELTRPSWTIVSSRLRAALVAGAPSPDGSLVTATLTLREPERDGRTGRVSIRDRFKVSGSELMWVDLGSAADFGDAAMRGEPLPLRGTTVAHLAPSAHASVFNADTTPPRRTVSSEAFGLALLSLMVGLAAASRARSRGGSMQDIRFAVPVVVLCAAIFAFWMPALFHFVRGDARRNEERLSAGFREVEGVALKAQAAIDARKLFESGPPGRFGTEELAFDLWSSSELAGPAWSSFVEVMDRSGAVVSRYARGLVPPPASRLPSSSSWVVGEERLRTRDNRVIEGRVAERLLVAGTEPQGGVRFGVGASLPVRESPGKAPSGANETSVRAQAIDRFVSSLFAGLVALAIGALVGSRSDAGLVLKSLWNQYSFRLFVAFFALAALSLSVFQGLVRGFVEGRLVQETEVEARRLGEIAERSLADLSAFQEAEIPSSSALSDAAVEWVASLVANNIELFDEQGALLATSEREEVDAGLVSRLAPARAYADIVLGEQKQTLHYEPGARAPVAVSTRVDLPAGRRGLVRLSLENREAQVRVVLSDLDRRMRLGVLALLTIATLLAVLMARRISEPIGEMTLASRRIAQGDLRARVRAAGGDEVGELAKAFNAMADDLVRQRSEIERRERVAAWADMASQVAHEVKNPLTPIQLAAEHLRRAWSARTETGATSGGDGGFSEILDACVRTILDQVDRLRDISSEFAAFVREPSTVREKIDVAALARRVVEPYLAVSPPSVGIEVRGATEPQWVAGDPRLLERAVRNLIQNAIQAVAARGQITVDVVSAETTVAVRVLDNGPGFDETTKARLFEPYFSTKAFGSGLGLALVKKVAQEMGGDATLARLDSGLTQAEIQLPRYDVA